MKGKVTRMRLTLSAVRTVWKPKLAAMTSSQASTNHNVSTSVPKSLAVAPLCKGTGGGAKQRLNPETGDNGQAPTKKAKTKKAWAAEDKQDEQDELEDTEDKEHPNPPTAAATNKQKHTLTA
ncbi:hypothetical protein FRC06_009053 [Ceratobasidium sp. 370]|nr:hypothetical protein FRC06_009053 [Ceratobasidium sp. 370]